MKVRCHNIEWDTDGDDVELPTEVVLMVEGDVDMEYAGADILSDIFGYCIFGYEFEVVQEDEQ